MPCTSCVYQFVSFVRFCFLFLFIYPCQSNHNYHEESLTLCYGADRIIITKIDFEQLHYQSRWRLGHSWLFMCFHQTK